MRIIFATTNEGKMKEIRMIMSDLGVEILSMKEAGCSLDIVEDGESFEENAIIKARAVAGVCNDIVLADDSGLEVDYLNKEPGIYSARYLGEDTPYSVKNKSIIDRLDGVEDDKRTARFVCAIAAVFLSKYKECALAHSCACGGRLRHLHCTLQCASTRSGFI